MSETIDKKVVEMEFDNRRFESNISTTISSVEKLERSLRMKGATQGLADVDAASKKCDMSVMGRAVETVQMKFSALQVMGVTALANITNSAVNAGKRIASALTIDPIRSGFSEYETKIGAIQTIMSNTASKGTTMEDVTRVIGELNTYADKTIYNFAEMTRNIGTFTAAGVGLEDSASAIQGIANLAAASGSTSQQASTAMYQLSQALAAGSVKLMDWNSVVNAGMGGEKFQEALKATARDHGVAVDELIEKNGSFRESLSEGWISADILNETLRKFTVEGAKEYSKSMVESGKWTQEQADALIKEAQAMEDAATKVKTFTQLWDTLKESAQSGWGQTWEILVGDFEEAKETLTKFSEVFGEIINKSAESRNKLLQGWKDAGGRSDLIDSLFNAFEAIQSVIKPIKEAFREIFPPTTVEQLVGLTSGLKAFTEKLKISDETADKLKRTFKGIFAVFDIFKQVISAVVKAVSSLFGGVGDLGGGILSITAKFGDWLVKLSEWLRSANIFNNVLGKIANVFKIVIGFSSKVIHGIAGVGDSFGGVSKAIESSGIYKLFEGLWKIITTVAKGIGKVFNAIAGGIGDILSNLNFSSILDTFNGLVAGGIGIGIIKFLNALKQPFESFGGIMDNIGGILDGVRGCFEAYQTQLKAGALIKIAAAIAILTISLVVLASIDQDKLMSSIAAIASLFGLLVGSLALLSKSTGKINGAMGVTTTMIGMSIAVLVLASALKKVSDIGVEGIFTGLIGIVGLMGILIAAIKILGNDGKKAMKGATQFILLAAAVKILASACADLAKLDWNGLTKGLIGVGVLLAELAIFLNLAKFSGKAVSTALGVVLLASAIKILASACGDFAGLEWGGIAKGLTGIGVLLAEILVFTKLSGSAKHVISTGVALIAISAALKIFASVMKDFGGMSWGEIGKGLVAVGGGLAIMAIGLKLMKGSLGGAAALVVAAAGLTMLTPVLVVLGAMSWSSIAKGLTALAGALLAIGIAATILKPLVVTILALSGAFALIGVGAALVGAGLVAAAAGIAALAAALSGGAVLIVEGITAIIEGIVKLIPNILVAIGEGIIGICDVIASSASSIGAAVKAIIEVICVVFIECVPMLVDATFQLISSVLESLVQYAPTIVDALFNFIIEILNGLARNIPGIIKAIMNVVSAIFEGVIDALGKIDTQTLLEGILALGMLAGLMYLLSGLAGLTGPAMVGVLGLGLVIAELALVLAAIGGLAQIPGLTWLVSEGGQLLLEVGKAIGGLIGGLVGGVMGGMTDSLPKIAKDLSDFMTNVQPFLDGVKKINKAAMEGAHELVGVILAFTGANLLNSLTSWLTGGSSLAKFGEELASFGPDLKAYADSVSGIDVTAIKASAQAAKALAEMTQHIPNEGGMISWFTGENSIAKFGTEIVELGRGLKGFSDAIVGISPENIITATNAAKALAEMANVIPNSEGVVSWFAGDNSIAKFGEEIIDLGEGLKGFSDAIAGVSPEAIVSAAEAAKALAEMVNVIPNEGGVTAWFAGDNSISKFAEEIIKLGKGLKGFSDATMGVVPENIVTAANAAKAIADMSNTIPNSGGMVTWFTGDNSVAAFGDNLVKLGKGLKGFSDATIGIVPATVIAASGAAKTLAEMASYIPDQGGIVAWFAGDNSIANFANELVNLGKGLKGFSDETIGINPENITAAANAAKVIAEMASIIPNSEGVVSWFAGDNSLSKFGTDLVALGKGLKGFSTETEGVIPENVTGAANAAKVIAEMSAIIPDQGGVVSWFAGDQSISKFGGELKALGTGLKDFSTETEGVVPENITGAANAAKILAEMVSIIPDQGGVVSWFAGDQSISKFGGELTALGKGLKGFSTETEGIVPENVTAAANAAKALAEIASIVPNEGGIASWFVGEKSLAGVASEFPKLGEGIKAFSDSVEGIDTGNITAAANAAKTLAEITKYLPDNADKLSSFGAKSVIFAHYLTLYFQQISKIGSSQISASKDAISAIKEVASVDLSGLSTSTGRINDFVKSVKTLTSIESYNVGGLVSTLNKLGETVKDSFLTGFKNLGKDLTTAAKNAINSFVIGVMSSLASAVSAGAFFVAGFAQGITANTFKAAAAARAMAAAAAKAARKELDEHSPSKVGDEIGDYFGIAFVNGISRNISNAWDASTEMATAAKDGLTKAIDKVTNTIDTGIDLQPTIRPVLDLTNVKAGANAMNGMLNLDSTIGVASNAGAIGVMMNRYNQNRGNDDVVSAIDKLRDGLNNVGNTYNTIGDIAYDDGSSVGNAIQALVDAIIVERRK